jgi:hypothetical protein
VRAVLRSCATQPDRHLPAEQHTKSDAMSESNISLATEDPHFCKGSSNLSENRYTTIQRQQWAFDELRIPRAKRYGWSTHKPAPHNLPTMYWCRICRKGSLPCVEHHMYDEASAHASNSVAPTTCLVSSGVRFFRSLASPDLASEYGTLNGLLVPPRQ